MNPSAIVDCSGAAMPMGKYNAIRSHHSITGKKVQKSRENLLTAPLQNAKCNSFRHAVAFRPELSSHLRTPFGRGEGTLLLSANVLPSRAGVSLEIKIIIEQENKCPLVTWCDPAGRGTKSLRPQAKHLSMGCLCVYGRKSV